MKNSIKTLLIAPLLMVLSFNSFAQFNPIDSIVYDENEEPWYLRDQMLVKFHPSLVNLNAVDNASKLTGTVEEFIDSSALQMLIDSGYFNPGLANLSVKKVFPWLNTSITTSETRLGTTIEMPKFWSVFLIYWDANSTGVSFDDALDTLNNLWPYVEYAEPNYLGSIDVLPDDDLFVNDEQAGLNPTTAIPNADINMDPAWDIALGRDNTRVGIFDTGINWDHEDFSQDGSGTFAQSRIRGGRDYVNSATVSTTTNLDAHGHGSACAGIIGAIRNNDLGVAGIAGGDGAASEWGVELFAMKISQSGSITQANAASAIIQGATSTASNGFGLHVLNNSYGFNSKSATLRNAVRFAYRNNSIVVVSSGNTGNQAVKYPASYRDEWVLKVGGSDGTGNWWTSATYGNNLDFIAPSTGNIYATTDHNSETTYTYNGNGTSFGAPHVAGAAALMCSYINAPSSAPNNLAPDDVENLLQRFANDRTAPPASAGYDDRTGFGRIDVGATMEGIELPRFEVKHYSTTFNNSSATKVSTNVAIIVSAGDNGVAAGTYYGDVYRITRNINISQPSGRTILDVWSRNSSSTLYANQPVVADENCQVVSWNQNSATMEGYIFHIKTNIIGQPVYRWLPSTGLNGTGTMALTVYSDDPTASSVAELPIDDNLLQIVPNPNDGNFSIKFELNTSQNVKIEVRDLSGKLMHSQPIGHSVAGQQNIPISTTNLPAGIYLCNVITEKGVFNKKINVVK